MATFACLFPGQGAQTVGMGQDFFQKSASAAKLFHDIDDIAGRSLSKLCFAGPAEELRRTINTQPTILAASLASWVSFKEQTDVSPAFVAGHSLGEFTALYAASVLSLESVVILVEERAKLMEECPPGAMSAVLGSNPEQVQEFCRRITEEHTAMGELVVIANFNTREQLVVSGNPRAVSALGALAKQHGVKVIPLPVGGAFHSPLMQAAADHFEKLVDACRFSEAKFPIVQNFNATPATAGNAIKEALKKQMRNSVRWYESIEFMIAQGVDNFIEIGPGKALTGMVRRINNSVQTANIEDSIGLVTWKSEACHL